jgi:histidyl-tRNA synthetase
MRINNFPPAGTRDFYPNDLKLQKWLFKIWTDISTSYGFEQYDSSIVEHVDLYTRKGGDDIVNEMYTFNKGGTALALRPEMTPTLARMIMQIYKTSPYKPLKWFSIPQCYRYETTIRGRKREHYQWNIDMFGANNIKYEIELFLILTKFFKTVKLTSKDIQIYISNRKILQKVLEQMKVADDLFDRACIIIDKIKKIPLEEFQTRMMNEIGLSMDDINIILQVLQVTNVNDLTKFIPENDECLLELQKLFELAKLVNIDEWLIFDMSIVRGLSYYTGLVFEAFFKNSDIKRSVCGGGRYDNIMQTYGHNERIPAIGFGFGDVVILDVLGEMGLLPKFTSDVDYVVIPFNDSLYFAAVMVSEMLRDKGKNVITYGKGGKRGDAFNYADKVGTDKVIFVAPDEWTKDCIVVKHLRKDSKDNQQIINLKEYVDSL